MPRMKGGDLISDFLIQEQVPYVFGICGHGNVGLLDALFRGILFLPERDLISAASPARGERKDDVIFIPPGVEHAIYNTGMTDLRFIVVTSPPEE